MVKIPFALILYNSWNILNPLLNLLHVRGVQSIPAVEPYDEICRIIELPVECYC